jgi:hypothetical protein
MNLAWRDCYSPGDALSPGAEPLTVEAKDAGGVSAQHHRAERPGRTLTMSGPEIGGRSRKNSDQGFGSTALAETDGKESVNQFNSSIGAPPVGLGPLGGTGYGELGVAVGLSGPASYTATCVHIF